MSTIGIVSGITDRKQPIAGFVYWQDPRGNWWGVRMGGSRLFDFAWRGLREMELSSRMPFRPVDADVLLIELEDGRDFRVQVGKLREWNAAHTPVFKPYEWDDMPR